jgi:predicted DsbA family dithiol-disulfide isomerase
MQIDVWSDVVCPWCYIGKRRLEAALAQFEHAGEVTVVWHSFQLDPSSPKQGQVPTIEVISKKYGLTAERAKEMIDHVTAVAAQDGLTYHLDATRSENTRDAHRLLHLAAEHGRQDALKEALLEAYFTKGASIGDPASLKSLAIAVGLPEAAVDALLADSEVCSPEVDADIATARQLGIRGVPFFVIDQRLGVSGAQPAEMLLGALREGWAGRTVTPAAAPGCSDDACDVSEA